MTYNRQLTALLVIDPYNDFISEGGKIWDRIRAVAEANGCVPHMLQVLNAARKAKLQVFYALHHRYRPGDYETWKYIAPIQKAAWVSKSFEYGTWGGEIRPGFEPKPGEIVATEHWSAGKVRPGGTLLFMGGTGGRHRRVGLVIASTVTAALPALTANLALELAPIRVKLIAAGFVDTPLSASLLGDELENRRTELRAALPIRRVVGPADVAALAVHIMTNTALTGATYDIDGGQQLL